jgi:hypothetical protein
MNNHISASWGRIAFLAVWLCLACGAAAQATANPPASPADSTTATNQEAAPTDGTNNYVLVPDLITPRLSAQDTSTNLPVATTTEPPVTGPRPAGSGQLTSPLMGTSVFGAPAGVAAPVGPSGAPLVYWGPVDVHASMGYSVVYGNGVESQPGQQQKTFVNTFSPGIFLNLGSRWTLAYSPSYAVYSSSAFHNALSESAVLNGATTYEDWSFSLSQAYAYTAQPLIETGAQTSQESYNTALGATYQMNGTLSLQLGANQNIRLAPAFTDLDEWSGNVQLNDQLMPQFGVGIQLTGGYDDVSAGSSMPFESLQANLRFTPGEKLSIALSGGATDRQFVHPSAPSLIDPVFAASIHYQVLPHTGINLNASRSVNPSFYANQVTVLTSVGGSIVQQLSRKFSLGLSAGYTMEPLTSIEPVALPPFFIGTPPATTLTVDRKDTYTTYGVSLNYAIITRGSISAFYSSTDNSSGQANFKYSSSQVGLSVNYRY